jgi:DNA recombination-dependent growth factor C
MNPAAFDHLTPEQLRSVGHGRLVSHLRLQWRDALDVTLSADAVLRRIQFGELLLAGIDADADDSAAGLASAQLAHTLPWVIGICAWLRAQFAAEQPQHAPPPAAAGVAHGERVH